MIRKILNGEEHLISNDPVRPHIPFNERVGPGRGIFVLDDDSDKVRAVICVAYCKDIPTNELELKVSRLLWIAIASQARATGVLFKRRSTTSSELARTSISGVA
jgi:hypothetical protein